MEKCQDRHKFRVYVSKSPQFLNPTQYHDIWPTRAPNIATSQEHYTISATFCAPHLNIATIRYPPTQYHHIEKYLLGLATSARTMSQYHTYPGVRLNIATICHPLTQYRHIQEYLHGLATYARPMSQYSHSFGIRLNIVTICGPHYPISPPSAIPTRKSIARFATWHGTSAAHYAPRPGIHYGSMVAFQNSGIQRCTVLESAYARTLMELACSGSYVAYQSIDIQRPNFRIGLS